MSSNPTEKPATSVEQPTSTPSRWTRFWSSLSHGLGFQRIGNFIGFVILGGAMFGFSLARMEFWSPKRYLKAFAPGEAYWFKDGTRKVGMLLHLGAILPCGVFLVFQFVPRIRQKYVLFHRINGYFVLSLLAIGLTGGLMVSRHAFGGEIATQGALFTLAFIVLASAALGYYNIKRRQFEEHRKWMLRTAVYLGAVITVRVLMILSAIAISHIGEYTMPWYCDEIGYTLDYNVTKIAQQSPDCINAPPSRVVLVHADLGNAPIQLASALRSGFGNALWVSIILHIAALELYLRLTPSETARLRAISYQRQLEAGAKHPGSEGLTSDRLGDAPAYQAN